MGCGRGAPHLGGGSGRCLVTGERLPNLRRAALLLLVLGFGFVAWKEGFVRQDPAHMAVFFGWMLAPWVGLRWSARHGLPLAAGFAAVAILYFAAPGFRPAEEFGPVENARTAVDDLRAVLDPDRRAATRQGARFAMASQYGLDRRSLALLRGRTVDVWPWETGIVWTYGLDWQPLPMFRGPTTYTSWLDERNAQALASRDGPQRIVRHKAIYAADFPVLPSRFGIDGRYAPYDAPATTRAMLCHFEALRTTNRYQVLGRVGDRCGEPRLLSSTPASYGEQVRIPKPAGRRQVVFARIDGAEPSGIEALRTFAFRAPPRYVVFDGRVRYRVVPNVLGDGLILDTPPGTDFPKPFALAPDARTVGLRKQAGPLSPNGELRFDFYAMRVQAPRCRPIACERT
jgi:hypothetical protein